MKLGRIDFLVGDPLWSKDFYQDILGFEVVAIESDQTVRLRRDEVEICLRAAPNRHDDASWDPAPLGLVFYTEDVEKAADELAERGLVVEDAQSGASGVVFTDMEGHWFRLESGAPR